MKRFGEAGGAAVNSLHILSDTGQLRTAHVKRRRVYETAASGAGVEAFVLAVDTMAWLSVRFWNCLLPRRKLTALRAGHAACGAGRVVCVVRLFCASLELQPRRVQGGQDGRAMWFRTRPDDAGG